MEEMPDTPARDELAATLAEDVRVMARHALATGRPVNASWVQHARDAETMPFPDPELLRRLGRAHESLSLLVAPATPRSLRYITSPQRRHVRLVRVLAAMGVVFVVGFIGLSTDPDVGAGEASFERGVGHELFVNEMFQLCAAGLGAVFAALFALSVRLRDYTLDERDEFASMVRIMLGLVAGLVLAQLVPADGGGRDFQRPLLALMGGFSVDVVYQTLRRLVDLASSVIAPAADTAQADRAMADARESQVRVGVAQRLVRLRAGVDGAAAAEIDAIIEELAPSDAVSDAPTLPAGPVRRRGPG